MSDVFLLCTLLGALLALPACADEIRPVPELDAGAVPAGKVATVRNPDGTYTTRIDATASDAWVRVDLGTGAEAGDGGGWDLAAQRFHLMLDGGVSGDGGVAIAPVAGPLAAVTVVPTTGWITDAADGPDDGDLPDYAFEQGDGWYAYDPQTHVLTPRPLVWVLRTRTAQVIALTIEDYYDDDGTSGHFMLHWAPLAGGHS